MATVSHFSICSCAKQGALGEVLKRNTCLRPSGSLRDGTGLKVTTTTPPLSPRMGRSGRQEGKAGAWRT